MLSHALCEVFHAHLQHNVCSYDIRKSANPTCEELRPGYTWRSSEPPEACKTVSLMQPYLPWGLTIHIDADTRRL